MVDALRLDLRSAIRSLAQKPGYALLAVLTLAVGIGVNTVAFSAVNAFLFKPVRFPGSDRLGWITTQAAGTPYDQTSWPDYQDLSRSTRAFEGVAAEGRLPLSMRTDGRGEQVWSLLVSSNYLTLLEARPEIGRVFTDVDRAASEIPAVLSHRFWRRRLGGGDSIAGRTLVLNGRSVSIVGVLSDSFQGPGGFYEPEVWVPLDRLDVFNLAPALQSREHGWLGLVGRLRPGVSVGQADGELKAIATRLAVAHPTTNRGRSAAFAPMRDGNPEVRRIAPFAWIALSIVGIVLVIACFNVAGLMLARVSERQREIGIRTALGASRARIMRQLATEGTLLAGLGGIAALVLATWSADLLAAFSLPAPIPQRLHIVVDARLIAFIAALVAVAGILPALAPALQATRPGLQRANSGGGQGRPSGRTRHLFVVAQIAGSTLFLAAALLFVRSFVRAATFDPGFETAHLLVAEIDSAPYGYTPERARALTTALRERVAALPGVLHAAVADRAPFYTGYPQSVTASFDGADCATVKCPAITTYSVGRDYFAALGLPLSAGRDFLDDDLQQQGVVVVNETLAERFWAGRRAVGQRLRLGAEGRTVEVIGVVKNGKYRSLTEDPTPLLYRPMLPRDYAAAMMILARTHADPRLLIGAVAGQLAVLDPDLPPAAIKTMTQRLEMPLWPARTAAAFFSICGTLALSLAAIGLFGVTFYTAAQRTREFGVRVALGATPARVMRLVMREGVRVAIPGVLVGIAGALIAGRMLARALVGVSAADPLSLLAAALIQGSVAMAACVWPAWRATRADPIAALRHE